MLPRRSVAAPAVGRRPSTRTAPASDSIRRHVAPRPRRRRPASPGCGSPPRLGTNPEIGEVLAQAGRRARRAVPRTCRPRQRSLAAPRTRAGPEPVSHRRWPSEGRPPPGRDQGVDRRRADPRCVSAGGALDVAALFLAHEGSYSGRRQVRSQTGEEAPGDVGRGEEGGIGAQDRLLGRTEEEGRQEVGAPPTLKPPAAAPDAALDDGGPVPRRPTQ